MKKRIKNWIYGDMPMVVLEDFDPELLSRLRSLTVLALSFLFGSILFTILFDVVILIVTGVIGALYLGWEIISLYRAVQMRQVKEMICCIVSIRQSAWDKYKKSKSLELINSNDKCFEVVLPANKNAHQYVPDTFVRILYNEDDGILERNDISYFRTLYSIKPCPVPDLE